MQICAQAPGRANSAPQALRRHPAVPAAVAAAADASGRGAAAAAHAPLRRALTVNDPLLAGLDVAAEEAAEDLAAEAAAEQHDGFRERGRAGHIKRIVVQNFMCHEHLEVVFG